MYRVRTTRIRSAAAVSLTALAAVALALSPTRASAQADAATEVPARFWTGSPDAAAYRAMADADMKAAQAALDRLLAVQEKRTIENTLVPFSETLRHSDNAGYQSGLIEQVHPDSAMRAHAEEITRISSKFQEELRLNRGVYDALTSLDLTGADAETRYMVEKTLRDFRRAGVDKNEATRKRIGALREELVQIGQEFEKNIRNDSRKVQYDPAELEGVPEDFLKAHPAGADGKITVSTDYPDYFPVMTYAKNAETRRRLLFEFMNRAYPANMAVLDRMIAKRHELARLLGFKNWADYVTGDKMIENEKNAAAFIERLKKLTRKRTDEEYLVYLKRKKEDVPDAKAVEQWDRRYYGQLIRKRDYAFDAQEARPYFAFAHVKQGVLDVTSKLFGVTYRRVEQATVWHPSVEAYDVLDGDRVMGRFFLDLHPRPGKYNHAAQFTVRQGVSGLQLPEAVLVCNFPGDRPDDPGMMEHSDVRTFFHEFGHLLHTLFAGQHRWEPTAGISTEWDFVEAPSQMLEEWCWDPAVLRTFAKHHQTGEPIPAEMVERMRRADTFGRATTTGQQALLSAISLSYYNRDPKLVDTDKLLNQLETQFSSYPPMPGTHFQAAFGHLDGYSAIYYTYMWSLVISKDLFAAFPSGELMGGPVAKRYREMVLSPGGSKPARQLVRDFLQREYNYTAFEKWLDSKE